MYILFIICVILKLCGSVKAVKPNFIFLLVDDLGWNGFGFRSNNTEVHTPVNITSIFLTPFGWHLRKEKYIDV